MITFKRRTAMLIGGAMMLHAESSVVLFQPKPANTLELFVGKTGVLSGKRHRFEFAEYEGKLEMDKSVEFTIRSAAISCRDTWVKSSDLATIEQFAKKDMLASEKYPTIRFASTAIEAVGGDEYRVKGMLQIRDVRKPVDVMVRRSAGEYLGLARFRMTDFGLKPPSAAFGLVGTKDELEFRFKLAGKAE
jgi:polyisoprenoid-binding protein YceI